MRKTLLLIVQKTWLHLQSLLWLSSRLSIGLASLLFTSMMLSSGMLPAGGEATSKLTQTRESTLQSRTEESEAASISAVTALQLTDDPSRDGWDTEVFTLDAEKQLARLGEILAKPEMLDSEEHIQSLITPDFACGPLLPKKVRETFRDRSTHILRADRGHAREDDRNRGVSGLVAALRTLLGSFADSSNIQASFKIFKVQRVGPAITTRQYFTLSGRTSGGNLAQNATWTLRWRQLSGDSPPRIEHIAVDEYQRVVARSPSQTLFSDCTEAVLGHNESFRLQLMRGMNHWMPRIEARLGLDPFGHQGVAVGDVNRDGLDDVYVCQTGGLPNRLFIQNEDGTAVDASMAAGVDLLDLTRSPLFIDVDNDGDQDLMLALSSALLFMANDGKGRFLTQGRVPVNGEVFGLSAADYDQDSDLDLYVCVYRPHRGVGELGTPVPYHDANNGGANLLLRNDSEPSVPGSLANQAGSHRAWKFTDVTDDVGLDHNNTRWSFAASWEDFDNDGDQDLYVANDYGRNNLYRNEGGRFVDVAGDEGVEDISAGMGVSWGDYNRDGLMDLHVSNMFSSAGNRITDHPHFKRDTSGEIKTQYRRHARGNSLFENTDGKFRDVSVSAGITMGRWAWGSKFLDINNDGWEDLVVLNGFVTNQKLDDL